MSGGKYHGTTRGEQQALVRAINRNQELDEWKWRSRMAQLEPSWEGPAVAPNQEDAVFLREVVEALSAERGVAKTARFLRFCDNSLANQVKGEGDPQRERANVMRQRKWLKDWLCQNS